LDLEGSTLFQKYPQAPSVRLLIPAPGKNLLVLALAGLTISILAGIFVFWRGGWQPLEKSIAVLPFSNFSSDEQNAYFADGIQDDPLTNLAKISDLKVILRTSVMPFRGQAHNAREIGKALDVATILEGSVRRA
jgi:hypothetical protein